MPIFKLFTAEPEGIVITAPLFEGTGDVVCPSGEGTFTIPSAVITGISWGVGEFNIPSALIVGDGAVWGYGAGVFNIPAMIFDGSGGDINADSTGEFHLPGAIFAGTGGLSSVDGSGEFTLGGLLFTGFGGVSSEYVIDPDEGVDLILNLARGVRVI